MKRKLAIPHNREGWGGLPGDPWDNAPKDPWDPALAAEGKDEY